MSINLVQSQALNELAGVLYEFLPGSGNRNFAFPMAAAEVGLGGSWIPGSKRPAILKLLENTYDHQRHRFCPLILAVVRQSLAWRSGKGMPLTVEEVDHVNALLLRLEFKIPELHDSGFRGGLEGGSPSPPVRTVDPREIERLTGEFVAISSLAPIPRGFAFERLLNETFALFNLAPRGSFRLVGEQIDGSFHLGNETYLLEARWQGPQVGNRELQSFAGAVRAKAGWARGLFVSYSGFSSEGLEAFARGAATPIICADGADLWHVLNAKLDLGEMLAQKTRRAAETGRAFVPVRDLNLAA
jgi:hypothetical protein